MYDQAFVDILQDKCGTLCQAALGEDANVFLAQYGFSTDTVVRSINYRLKYFDNIRMIGATYSTVIGSANVATEVSYRLNTPLLGGNVPRTPKRWQLINWHLNTLMVFEPSFLWDFSSFTAEYVVWYVPGALEYNEDDLSNTKPLAVQNTPWVLVSVCIGHGNTIAYFLAGMSLFPGILTTEHWVLALTLAIEMVRSPLLPALPSDTSPFKVG